MLRPDGYVIATDLSGAVVYEGETVQCCHCQRQVHVKPHQPPGEVGGWCPRCDKFICGPCADLARCLPWEAALERTESRDRFLRSAGMG